jgi:hypothetical protein
MRANVAPSRRVKKWPRERKPKETEMKLAKLLAVVAVVAMVGSIVMAQDAPAARGLRGTIVKVEGANVIVKTMARGTTEAKEVTVATDDKTAVTVDGKEAKLADLKAGMRVNVTPAEGTATKIAASTPTLRGQVTKVDGATVAVKTTARGGQEAKEVAVTTDAKTVVTIDGKEAKVADLKADLYVTVTPAEGTATKIVATTEAPARGGRGGA